MAHPQINHCSRPCQLVLLLLFSRAYAGPLDAGAQVIDRAVALIDGRVLTWSELDFEARVFLIYRGGVEAASAPLDMDVLRPSLETAIQQRLQTAEADKLMAYPLDDGELETAVVQFRRRFKSERDLAAFLARHEADGEVLAGVLKRMLRSERILEGKLKLKAQVSEGEARRVQAANPELAQLPLPSVRQRLMAIRFSELAATELKVLRKNGAVRLLGPFGPNAADAGTP
jgi:hypothetical protein